MTTAEPQRSQPARMRCGKELLKGDYFFVHWSQPARMRCGKVFCAALSTTRAQSQPARMRCGKDLLFFYLWVCPGRNPHECAVAKIMSARCAALVTVSQPARMRCGKVAPLLCPNQKPREHELRSSFFSFSVSDACCDFLYDSTAFETFQHLYSKNRRIKTVRCGGVFF